jgi:hypothetical protein
MKLHEITNSPSKVQILKGKLKELDDEHTNYIKRCDKWEQQFGTPLDPPAKYQKKLDEYYANRKRLIDDINWYEAMGII